MFHVPPLAYAILAVIVVIAIRVINKRSLQKADTLLKDIFEVVTKPLSSPWYLLFTIIGTLSWMVYNKLSPHPIDDPKTGFPYTVLYYTLITVWIDLVIKVIQAIQSKMQQAQMDRLEYFLKTMHNAQEKTIERDKIIHHLVANQNRLTKQLLDNLKEGKDVDTNH